MASAKKTLFKLVSTAKTGYYKTTTNSNPAKKLKLKKYDPVIRKHVDFVQEKIK